MKILALAIALVSFGAIADEHHKHMVTISGWESGNVQDRSIDFGMSSNDKKNEEEVRNVALNYAYAITNSWQIGAKFKSYLEESNNKTVSGGDSTTYGVFGIYNFAGKLTDTNYLSLGYDMQENEDSDASGALKDSSEVNTWTLEFGHRFSLGHLWNMDFNWSPSIEVSRATTEDDAVIGSDDEFVTTAVGFNVLKVDILF